MVEKWKLALKEFLKEYEDDDDVIGALLYGSYANDTYNDYSDINVYLVLRDEAEYFEEGITESNSYIISYYKKNYSGIKENMEDELKLSIYNQTSTIFAYGKILYDVNGSVKELQDLALTYIDNGMKNVDSEILDISNKNIWYLSKELKASYYEERLDFYELYYELLHEIYRSYCRYENIPVGDRLKIYKNLSNKEFRGKNHIFKVPDEKFTKMYLKCYEQDKTKTMFDNITRLLNYYYEKQGGYNIRNYRHRWERN